MKRRHMYILGACLLAMAAASAEPVVEMEGTSIIGEQELPKVRFTIPWQEIPPARDAPRPWVSQVQEEHPAPLDRAYFQQLLQFKAPTQGLGAAPPPAAAGGQSTVRVIIRP